MDHASRAPLPYRTLRIVHSVGRSLTEIRSRTLTAGSDLYAVFLADRMNVGARGYPSDSPQASLNNDPWIPVLFGKNAGVQDPVLRAVEHLTCQAVSSQLVGRCSPAQRPRFSIQGRKALESLLNRFLHSCRQPGVSVGQIRQVDSHPLTPTDVIDIHSSRKFCIGAEQTFLKDQPTGACSTPK